MGCACAIIFGVLGAAYGTAKAGVGVSAAGVLRPDLIVRSKTTRMNQVRERIILTRLTDCMPIVMAGILAIYSLVISVMIANALVIETHIFTGFVHLGAGIAVGMCGLGAGFAIGITGDAGVRASAQQPRMFVGMMLIQIFAEVLGIVLQSDEQTC
jgi:V-type H+-transporting ATPase 16kDa proteolipid subunit